MLGNSKIDRRCVGAVLFLGGPADGHRMTVDPDSYVIRIPSTVAGEHFNHGYRREMLRADGIPDVLVFVSYEITIGQALQMLVGGYVSKGGA